MAPLPDKPIPTTTGELLFCSYLEAMGYPYEFEKQFPGRKTTPDFTLTMHKNVFLFDVKDFAENLPPIGSSQTDLYTRIREKIDQGRAQFKGFKDFPCALVLYNNGAAFVELESPLIMLGSMYGDAGFLIPVQGLPRQVGKAEAAFLNHGKMISPGYTYNTTISALMTLRHVTEGMRWTKRTFPNGDVQEALEPAMGPSLDSKPRKRHVGVVVWENAVARIPLSRELFTGPYDERWGYEDGHQTIVFRGEKLPRLEEL